MLLALNLADPTTNPTARFTDIGSLVNFAVPLLSAGAALGFLVMLLLSGYTILTGGGTAENIAKAQKTATFAVMGLVLVIAAYIIVKVISTILNVATPL